MYPRNCQLNVVNAPGVNDRDHEMSETVTGSRTLQNSKDQKREAGNGSTKDTADRRSGSQRIFHLTYFLGVQISATSCINITKCGKKHINSLIY